MTTKNFAKERLLGAEKMEHIDMTITVTEEQMASIRERLFKKYPYLYRKNTAYTAELIPVYKVKVDDKFLDDIKEALS